MLMSTVLKLFKTILFLIHYVLRYAFEMLPTHTTKKPKTNKQKQTQNKKNNNKNIAFLTMSTYLKRTLLLKKVIKLISVSSKCLCLEWTCVSFVYFVIKHVTFTIVKHLPRIVFTLQFTRRTLVTEPCK